MEGCENLPIVVVSAWAMLVTRTEKAVQMGLIQAVLAKPFDVDALVAVVERCLARKTAPAGE